MVSFFYSTRFITKYLFHKHFLMIINTTSPNILPTKFFEHRWWNMSRKIPPESVGRASGWTKPRLPLFITNPFRTVVNSQNPVSCGDMEPQTADSHGSLSLSWHVACLALSTPMPAESTTHLHTRGYFESRQCSTAGIISREWEALFKAQLSVAGQKNDCGYYILSNLFIDYFVFS